MSENSNLTSSSHNTDSRKDSHEPIQDNIQKEISLEGELRNKFFSYLVTLGFIFGPISLILDLLFTNLFDFLFYDPTASFILISIVFVIMAVLTSRKRFTQ
ncbi:MAG: hypothetical protein ACXAD7_04330 [Candidatus Kariarchaeaceae archaeon]|jgi:hypothetical protein